MEPAAASPRTADRPARRGRVRKRYLILLAMVVLLGWVGWQVYGVLTAKPGPLIDYTEQLIALSARYQPEGENGWPALVAALERFEAIGVPDVEGWPTESRDRILRFDLVHGGVFSQDRLKYVLAYLERIERSGVLEEIDAALAARRFVRTEFPGAEGGFFDLTLPELARARTFARARAASIRIAAEADDWTAVEQAWSELLELASALSHDPMLLSHLVAQAISVLAAKELNWVMVEREVDEAIAQRLLQSMGDGEILAPLELALEGERLMFYDLIQRTFTDDGGGDGTLMIDALARVGDVENTFVTGAEGIKPLATLAGSMFAGRAETLREFDRFMDAAVRQTRGSREEAEADLEFLRDFQSELSNRQIFLRLLLPVLDRPLEMRRVWRSWMNATRILIAIELYEARHGSLPASLDDLVPECLTEIPRDEVSGLPFSYVLRTPTPDDPRRLLLYSIGLDHQDNGAAETSLAPPDSVLLLRTAPESRNGYDYIFNRLRDPLPEVEN